MKISSFILTVAFAWATGSATAQTGNIELGVQGGISLISLRGNDFIDDYNSPTMGFSGGLFAQYNFTERVALRIDPGFERKGSIYDWIGTDAEGNEVVKVTTSYILDYLTVPVLVRTTLSKKYKIFVDAGPYIAFLLDHKILTHVDGVFNNESEIPYGYTDLDFGITVGTGISAPLGERLHLSIAIRNSLGLADIGQGAISNDWDTRTNATNLLIVIAYGI